MQAFGMSQALQCDPKTTLERSFDGIPSAPCFLTIPSHPCKTEGRILIVAGAFVWTNAGVSGCGIGNRVTGLEF